MTNSRFWWSFSHAYSRITGDTEPAGKPDRQTFSPLLFGPSWQSFWRHDLKHVLHLTEWSLKRLNQAVTVPLHSCGIKKKQNKKKTLPKTSLPKRQAHYSETGGWKSSWGKYCVQVVCLMLVISFWEATLFLWSHEKSQYLTEDLCAMDLLADAPLTVEWIQSTGRSWALRLFEPFGFRL